MHVHVHCMHVHVHCMPLTKCKENIAIHGGKTQMRITSSKLRDSTHTHNRGTSLPPTFV